MLLLYAIYFIAASLLAFFIPGNLFISKLRIPRIAKLTLSYVLGIAMFALQGFIFGYLNLRFLTFFYIFLAVIFWALHNKNFKLPTIQSKLSRIDLLILFVYALGVLMQIFSVIPTAIPLNNGVYFCCGVPDNLYHAALTKELIHTFPPFEPAISGIKLNNYHYLSNLVVADFVRIFRTNFIRTEFHFFPVFMSFLFGLSAYSLASVLKVSKRFTLLFLILIFFFVDDIFLIPLFNAHIVNFDISTVETSFSLWVSYSRYFSIVLFLGALTLLKVWLDKKTLTAAAALLLLCGTLIEFKVYAGFIFLMGTGFLTLYYLVKKDFRSSTTLISIGLLSILLYLPVNRGAGGLIFSGFWRVEDFIAQPSLGLVRLEQARRIFLTAGNHVRALIYDFLFLTLYSIASFGILFFGFFNTKNSLSKISRELHLFLLTSLIASLVLGFFFLQRTGGANTSQFFVFTYLIGAVYAALAMSKLTKKKLGVVTAIALIVLLLLPKNLYLLNKQYFTIQHHKGLIIDKSTTEAFNFINKNLKEGAVVLVDPSINNACILIPIYTKTKSFSCDLGAPGDRGIDIKPYQEYTERALSGTETKKYDYILTSVSHEDSENQKIMYENNNLKILTNE